jgi:hypothetical protein
MRLAGQKRNLVAAIAAVLVALPAAGAMATVDQNRDSVHHEVETEHNVNICGNLGTFTFDVTSHTHVVDSGKNFVFDLHETVKYTLVFDDPALGLWTAHAAENVHFVASRNGGVFFHNFNSKEGSIQIIQHEAARIDPDGNVTVDRTYEKIGSC